MGLARFIAEVFSRLRSSFFGSPAEAGDPRALLGRAGEALAARHLRKHRYKVLFRNFRAARGGEVDIVCRDKSCNTLVFVEVKTRASTEFGRPGEAVKEEKQHLIARGALAWLRMLDNPQVMFRFDIVEVVMKAGAKPEITIIPNAFPLPEPYVW